MLSIICALLIFIIGVFLYKRRPFIYVSYTWWVWFLAPELRRIVDYQSGHYSSTSPIMLAPYLVTAMTFLNLRKFPRGLSLQYVIPFFLCILGLVYSFLVGVVNTSPSAALFALLNWLVPIIFSFHLFAAWRSYPRYCQVIQNTFLWGVLVMGIYGVLQFVVAPPWDQFWMINSGMGSIGAPAPFEIRIFSTLNSPGPFAGVLASGLLLLFTVQGPIKFTAAGVGYLSFLLSMVRSAWVTWMISLLIFATFMKLRFQFRLLLTILLIGLLVLPLANMDPFADIINTRLNSLSDIQNDTSFNERAERYADFITTSLLNPLGAGLGVTGLAANKLASGSGGVLGNDSRLVDLDSGVLDILLSLGWLGGLPYLWGLIWLVVYSLREREKGVDLFADVSRSIALGGLVGLIGGNSLVQLGGMVTWSFLGMSLAACQYHRQK